MRLEHVLARQPLELGDETPQRHALHRRQPPRPLVRCTLDKGARRPKHLERAPDPRPEKEPDPNTTDVRIAPVPKPDRRSPLSEPRQRAHERRRWKARRVDRDLLPSTEPRRTSRLL